VRYNYKIPDGITGKCILKFFPPGFRLRFEKEIDAYNRFSERQEFDYDNTPDPIPTEAFTPRPLGFASWPIAKYSKTIGRGIDSLVRAGQEQAGDSEANEILVLMLEYVEGTPLSHLNVSVEMAVAALSALAKIHNAGVIHGDISEGNALVHNEGGIINVVWIDFSSSWTRGARHISWEMDRAADYFAQWVWTHLVMK